MTATRDASQAGVANWFDRTYAEEGLGYLRPYAAYPIFVQLLNMEPGSRLLDVACGPGHLLRAADARGLSACGVDLSQQALRIERQYLPQVPVLRANAQQLPFSDGSFDAVTCVGAIERFLDRDQALSEFVRVSAPRARLCVFGRNARTLSWRVYRQFLGRQNHDGHQDALTLDGWSSLFGRHGLTVSEVHPDQWGRQRLRWLLRGRRDPDPTKKEPVVRSLLPLDWANEFVFILDKAPKP